MDLQSSRYRTDVQNKPIQTRDLIPVVNDLEKLSEAIPDNIVEAPFTPDDNPIVAGDSYQEAFEKAQGQINGIGTEITTINGEITQLQNNEYKITYYEVVSGAGGSLTVPTGATINEGEFGSSGNCILSKINVDNKPTFESPKTAGGVIVTASLDPLTGIWAASGVYTDPSVALIYSLKINALNYPNLDYDFIVESEEISGLPSSSTDNAIARFDSTNGNIQDSTVLVNDDGSITLPSVSTPAYTVPGRLLYDVDNDTLGFFNSNSNVFLQVGEEVWMRCINVSGSTILNGSAVYVNGSNSNLPTIALAQANSSTTTVCAGLATHDIANNTTGFVTVVGTVRGLNTSGLSVGNVFLSASVAGELTNTAPTSPNYRYRIGFVTVVNASTGMIQVTPTTAAVGNGTPGQVLGINISGNQAFLNQPLSGSGFRKFGTTTFERWYVGNANSANLTTITIGRNNIQYMPLIVGKTCTLASVGVNITGAGTAGALMTIALYDSVNSLPVNRVVDCGTLLVDAIAAVKITGLSTVLLPGLYWFAINHNSVANVTMSAIAVAGCEPILGFANTLGTTSGTFYTNTSSTYAAPLPTTAITPTTIGITTPPAIYFYLLA